MDMKSKNDRRYQRTHETIIDTAMELALADGWKKIRVTKLAEKANINRNSFYLHFDTVERIFDEIENRLVSRYGEYLSSAPVLEIMVKDQASYRLFGEFFKNEQSLVSKIKRMGRAENLIAKMEEKWTEVIEKDLSASSRYSKAKDLVLPYIYGCTLIFFTKWINDPYGFDVEKYVVFSGEFMHHILSFSSSSSVGDPHVRSNFP